MEDVQGGEKEEVRWERGDANQTEEWSPDAVGGQGKRRPYQALHRKKRRAIFGGGKKVIELGGAGTGSPLGVSHFHYSKLPREGTP